MPAPQPAPTSPVDAGRASPVHHAHAAAPTGAIDTVLATNAAEVAGHPVTDDELAQSPVFSSLVEEKDVSGRR